LRRILISDHGVGWMVVTLAWATPQYASTAVRLLSAFPDEHLMARAHRPLFAALTARRDGEIERSERRASEAQLALEKIEHHYYAVRCIELAGRRAEAHTRYLLPVRCATHPTRAFTARPSTRKLRTKPAASRGARPSSSREHRRTQSQSAWASRSRHQNRIAEILSHEGVSSRAESRRAVWIER
jgi:hypothetical protein